MENLKKNDLFLLKRNNVDHEMYNMKTNYFIRILTAKVLVLCFESSNFLSEC